MLGVRTSHSCSPQVCLSSARVLCDCARAADAPNQELLVFAAASLTNVLDEIGAAYTQQTGQPVKFSYAASSALARQLEAGARADVFFSADLEWMDYVQARDLIDRATRRNVLGNRLVLVAPADSKIELKIAPGFALAAALGKGGSPRAIRRACPSASTRARH